MKKKFKAIAGESTFDCMIEGTEEEIRDAFVSRDEE